MARSMLSLGMFSARAAMIAARSRGFMLGSGSPSLADTVISRASLENSFERAASWRPLRCMMFLNCEWPAMARSRSVRTSRLARSRVRLRDHVVNVRLVMRVDGKSQTATSLPHGGPRLFEAATETHGCDAARKPGRIVGLHRDGAQR